MQPLRFDEFFLIYELRFIYISFQAGTLHRALAKDVSIDEENEISHRAHRLFLYLSISRFAFKFKRS